MRKYARSRRKNAKAARASENMHAARRCGGCENMQTVTNTLLRSRGSQTHLLTQERQSRVLYPPIARRLGAATFHTRGNFVAAAVDSTTPYCRIRIPPRLPPRPRLPRLPLVELYGACSRKFAFLTRAEWANLRKYALENHPGADCENVRSAKIILSSYAVKPRGKS